MADVNTRIDVGMFRDVPERPNTIQEFTRRLSLLAQQIDESIRDIREPEGVDGIFLLTSSDGVTSRATIEKGLITATEII